MKLLLTRSQVNGGKLYFYPDNELAHNLCRLMRRKTFVPQDLELLEVLGFRLTDLSTGKELIPCTESQKAL